MTRSLAVVCSLGMLLGCGSSSKSGDGTGGTGGSSPDAASGGSVGTGGGGSPGTGGSAGATGGTGSGGAAGGSAGADAGAAPGDAAAGTMSSVMITAAMGGTLTAGSASLLVPAGALATDKLLTVSVAAPAADEPGRDSLAGDVYDFGPSGTTFTVPVALSLPLPPGGVPAGKRAVVAWLDAAAGQWVPVPSSADGPKITGRVSHFTRFALLLLDQAAICPYGGACGGSIDGTWKYSSSCLKVMESEAFKCGTAGAVTLQQEYQVGGTITFGAGRYNAEHAITVNATMLYTPACIAAIKEGGVVYADCAQIQEAWRKQNPAAQWVCSGTVDQGCSCLLTQSVMNKVMGAYAVTGQQLTLTEDGKPAGKPSDFCVKGNTLSARDADGSVTTAVRQ